MIQWYKKTYKMSWKQVKYESKFLYSIHCYIISWHSNSLHNNVSIHLNKKFRLIGTIKGGGGA